MAELVQEDREEEEERGEGAHGDVHAVAEPGFWFGKIDSESVQTISAKTTSQLQLTPTRMPAIRPRVMLSRTVYLALLSRTVLLCLAHVPDCRAGGSGDGRPVLPGLLAGLHHELPPLVGRDPLPAGSG